MAERLPIYEIERDIIARLQRDKRLILSAPTGSGKSTQVPQMLLKHGLLGNGQVVVLQPRRLAARLLAARVAHELGVKLGEEVGYQIRFENVTSSKTKIRFVTEGVLLRQMINDPKLPASRQFCLMNFTSGIFTATSRSRKRWISRKSIAPTSCSR
jgi:ATP-dependent helicase HrpB